MSTQSFQNISASGSITGTVVVCDELITNTANLIATDWVVSTLFTNSIQDNTGSILDIRSANILALNANRLFINTSNIQVGNVVRGNIGINTSGNILFGEQVSSNVNFVVSGNANVLPTGATFIHSNGAISVNKNTLTPGWAVDINGGLLSNGVITTTNTTNVGNVIGGGALRVSGGASISLNANIGANVICGNVLSLNSMFSPNITVGNPASYALFLNNSTGGGSNIGCEFRGLTAGNTFIQPYNGASTRNLFLNPYGGVVSIGSLTPPNILEELYVNGTANVNGDLIATNLYGRANVEAGNVLTGNILVANVNVTKDLYVLGNIANDQSTDSGVYTKRVYFEYLFPRNSFASVIFCSVNSAASTTLVVNSGTQIPWPNTGGVFFAQGVNLGSNNCFFSAMPTKSGYKLIDVKLTIYIRSAITLTGGFLTLQKSVNSAFTVPANMTTYYLRGSYAAGETIQANFTGIMDFEPATLDTYRYIRILFTSTSGSLPINTNGPSNLNAISYFMVNEVMY